MLNRIIKMSFTFVLKENLFLKITSTNGSLQHNPQGPRTLLTFSVLLLGFPLLALPYPNHYHTIHQTHGHQPQNIHAYKLTHGWLGEEEAFLLHTHILF